MILKMNYRTWDSDLNVFGRFMSRHPWKLFSDRFFLK